MQFIGIEPLQQGKIHFAGEGTSMEFQGFMEGAVTTGERVANEIRRRSASELANRPCSG
jgi:monoamine oxidase